MIQNIIVKLNSSDSWYNTSLYLYIHWYWTN